MLMYAAAVRSLDHGLLKSHSVADVPLVSGILTTGMPLADDE